MQCSLDEVGQGALQIVFLQAAFRAWRSNMAAITWPLLLAVISHNLHY